MLHVAWQIDVACCSLRVACRVGRMLHVARQVYVACCMLHTRCTRQAHRCEYDRVDVAAPRGDEAEGKKAKAAERQVVALHLGPVQAHHGHRHTGEDRKLRQRAEPARRQHVAGNMQQTTCSRQHVADNMQQTTCSRRHAAGNMQQTACSRQHAAGKMQRTPCSGHRALCSMQRTRCSGQHTTCSTRFDVPYARHGDRTVRAVQLLLVVACASPGVRPIAP